MAVDFTKLTGANGTGTSVVTPSITPGANRLILVRVYLRAAAGSGGVTVTGNGLTYVEFIDFAHNDRELHVFRAMGASPSAGAVTVSTVNSCNYIGVEIEESSADVDTSGTNDSCAIGQIGTGQSTTSSATATLTVPVAAFAASTNTTCAFGGSNNDVTDITWETSPAYTEVEDAAYGGGRIGSAYLTQEDTSVDVTFVTTVNVRMAAIAWEVKAAAGGPVPITGSDALDLGAAEGAPAILAALARADALDAGLAEGAPAILAALARADALDAGLAELAVILYALGAADALGLAIAPEQAAVAVAIAAADALDHALAETAATAVFLARADTLDITSAEAAPAILAALTRGDALDLSAGEAAAVRLAVEAADALDLTLAETAALAVAIAAGEAIAVSLDEVAQILALLDAADLFDLDLDELAQAIEALFTDRPDAKLTATQGTATAMVAAQTSAVMMTACQELCA